MTGLHGSLVSTVYVTWFVTAARHTRGPTPTATSGGGRANRCRSASSGWPRQLVSSCAADRRPIVGGGLVHTELRDQRPSTTAGQASHVVARRLLLDRRVYVDPERRVQSRDDTTRGAAGN